MRHKLRLKYFVIVCRPLNVVIGTLSIFIGAFITGTINPLLKVMFAGISGGFIAAAANVINDYYDIAIDRINKPNRPIAAGVISPEEGFVYSILLFLLGNLFGYFVNWQALTISLFSSGLLFLYSWRLKRTVLWGNLMVSLVTALAFVYGGIAVNRLGYALVPAIFSFFYHLGREIIKDVEDVAGDRADHIQTLPIKYGERLALKTATWIYVFLIILTTVPYIFKIFGMYYLLIVVGVVNLVVVYVLWSMWSRPEVKNLARLSMILKLNMFAGLVAIYVGKF